MALVRAGSEVWAGGFDRKIYVFCARSRLLLRALIEHSDSVGALLVARLPAAHSDESGVQFTAIRLVNCE